MRVTSVKGVYKAINVMASLGEIAGEFYFVSDDTFDGKTVTVHVGEISSDHMVTEIAIDNVIKKLEGVIDELKTFKEKIPVLEETFHLYEK